MPLTSEQIQAWAAHGESEIKEFKSTTGRRTDAARTICAMLNHRGGRVLFGVTPAQEVRGQDVSDKTLEDVATEFNCIEPAVFPTIDRVAVGGGKEVVVAAVERGFQYPYSFHGKAYRRSGAANFELSRDEYNRLLLERLHNTERWENQPAPEWAVEDLNKAEIVRTLEEAIRRGRSEDPGTRDPKEILRGLTLIKDGQILRAAVALFADSERLLPDYPQCLLRLARFEGTDKTEFIDNRQYHGNAFDLLLRAERFMRDHLPVAGRIVPNLFEREDDPLYPPSALREALANAICHRDYSISGGSIGVAIYDDRLEITSPGELHFGLIVDDLFKRHESRPWNPIIANVFYKRGIIETWGRGTQKIAELAQRAGLPRPEIEQSAGTLIIRFKPSRYHPPKRIGQDLTARQRKILGALGSGGTLSLRELGTLIGKSSDKRTLRRELSLLKNFGLVETWGHGRGARWAFKRRRKASEK
ncbi:MAG: ATP-binding protein [Elusimicrobiota bacterium]